jgi:hypothetical protein
MTVLTATAKAGPYAGAGTTGPFTVPFRFLEAAHLRVIKTSVAGVDADLVLSTDYTVSGAGGSSGSVTLVAALAVGEKLTVVRNVPATQEADYVPGDAFPAESHEEALDKLTMLTQQNAEEISRSIRVPASDPVTLEQLTADLIVVADNLADISAVVANTANIDAVAAIDADVITVAANVADITNFADVYLGPSSSDPATRLDGSALQTGDLYFSTLTARMRVYSSGVWLDAGTPIPLTIVTQEFSGNGSTVAFTLSQAPAFEAAADVYISGVAQKVNVDYDIVDTTLTFTTAPPSGTDNIYVKILSSYAGGAPNDGSVTSAKLASTLDYGSIV